MKKNIFLLSILIIHFSLIAFAQDDLMKMIDQSESKQSVIATFKTTRIINAHSNETVKAHTLDFRITHRFGDIEGGFHSGFGLYSIADVRIAFEYGITDKLTVAMGRSKAHEFTDGYLKYRVLEQTTDNKIPIAITTLAEIAHSSVVASKDSSSATSYHNQVQRLSYTWQLILARKFGEHFSIAILPTYLHRNYVAYLDENGIFSLGIGARFKFSKSCAFIADYFYTFSKYRKDNNAIYFNPLAIGLEIETGGHVFHLTFTNSEGIIENSFIPYTQKSWLKDGIRWGFNISRDFNLGKK